MNIVIAGGTGFIGQHLVKYFLEKSYQIEVIGRSTEKIERTFRGQVISLTWKQEDEIKNALQDADVLINLTGANIGEKRWTVARKTEILSGRISATHMLAKMCASLGENAPDLLNANAIGIYAPQAEKETGLPPPLDEETPIDFYDYPNFLTTVGRQWALATKPADEAGVRVVVMRFGVVLDKDKGSLPKISKPFLFGLGGRIGSGHQPFSWITATDLVRAIDFIIQHKSLRGSVNCVAPGCVTQAQFAQALGKALHRPAFFPMPSAVLKLIFGQMGEELLLKGQHVFPAKLLDAGFKFEYPDIELALTHIYK